MPIFFQQDINEHTRLAIWKIEEEEAFFDVPLQRSITHPHKRLQHLAGRYLLRYLFPGFPLSLIKIADTRKPFLDDEAYHFSISHCDDFAAVIASSTERVGIDIEIISSKIERIQHKFLSSSDSMQVKAWPDSLQYLTLAWSCKEALFKWYGRGEVDFRKHMVLHHLEKETDQWKVHAHFQKETLLELTLHARFFSGLCLSYVATGAELNA